jgi:RNA polymerase sigma factor (sigma-70 family)
VALARDGHDRAFEEIVHRYRSPLVAFAAAIVPTHRAEDVVQEALTKAHSTLRASDAEIKVRPWLYTIVRNRALNDLRDEPDHAQLDESIDGVPQPPEVAARRAELAQLVTRVKALPDAQREALVQRELEGRSHEEIAVAIGATPGAVRALIFRARTALRDGMGLLIPMPLLRALLDGTLQPEAGGAGLGGAAAGITAGGGGIALKAGGAFVVGVLAVGSGLALHHGGKNPDASGRALAAKGSGHHGLGTRQAAPGRSLLGSNDGSGSRGDSSGPGIDGGSGSGGTTSGGQDESGSGAHHQSGEGSGGQSESSSGSSGGSGSGSGTSGDDGHSGSGGPGGGGSGSGTGGGDGGSDGGSGSGSDGGSSGSDDGSDSGDELAGSGDETTTTIPSDDTTPMSYDEGSSSTDG